MISTEYFPAQSLGTIPVPYVGGFSKWYYTFIENIDVFPSIDASTQYLTDEPTLISGKTWYGPVTVPKGMAGFTEATTRTKAGLYWKTKFQATVPGSNSDVDVNIDNLVHHQLCIVGKLRSGGYWKIIGTKKKGLTVDDETDTGMGSRAVVLNKLSFTFESIIKNPVLPSFSGDNSSPATLPPGTGITIFKPDSMTLTLNTDFGTDGGDTVVNWISDYVTRFGAFPEIEVWLEDGAGGYNKGNIPIDATNTPPTSFIIRNGGAAGKVKFM